MNKVAKHYGFFMRTIGPAITASGARSKDVAMAELEKEYPPSAGWEIVQMSYTGNPPEGFTFAFGLTQFEYTDAPAANVKSK